MINGQPQSGQQRKEGKQKVQQARGNGYPMQRQYANGQQYQQQFNQVKERSTDYLLALLYIFLDVLKKSD